MSYFGGKGQDGVYQAIINEIPRHSHYYELFAGGASIYKKKEKACVTYLCELDTTAPAASLANPYSEYYKCLFLNECGIAKAEQLENAYLSHFVFVDPPYLHSTRRSDTRYNFELSDDDHVRLLTALQSIKRAHVMITHYPNPMYDDMLADWRQVPFTSVDRGGNVREEMMYMNYDTPEILHDARYLGENKDIRQRINRQIKNGVRKVMDWDSQKRARFLEQLFQAISEDEKELISDFVRDHYY